MGLAYRDGVWVNVAESEGVCQEDNGWYYLTCHYGSIERFGPYITEDKAKIAYLEHLLWNANEFIESLEESAT